MSAPPFVIDQEGWIHRNGCTHLQGTVDEIHADEIRERDLCRECWPPKPVPDVAADRSESA